MVNLHAFLNQLTEPYKQDFDFLIGEEELDPENYYIKIKPFDKNNFAQAWELIDTLEAQTPDHIPFIYSIHFAGSEETLSLPDFDYERSEMIEHLKNRYINEVSVPLQIKRYDPDKLGSVFKQGVRGLNTLSNSQLIALNNKKYLLKKEP